MFKYILILIPYILFSSDLNNFSFNNDILSKPNKEIELTECYNNGKGSNECGKSLANILKNNPEKEELAAEIFLDLSLKGDVEATRELALLYIYGKKIKQDCQKGIYILLNAADGRSDKKQSTFAFKDISILFEKGICVKQDLKKAKKYNDIYLKKIKEGIE